jgi:hypothetical protein
MRKALLRFAALLFIAAAASTFTASPAMAGGGCSKDCFTPSNGTCTPSVPSDECYCPTGSSSCETRECGMT